MRKNYTNPSMSLLKYAEADVIGTTSDITAVKNDGNTTVSTEVKVKMSDIIELN